MLRVLKFGRGHRVWGNGERFGTKAKKYILSQFPYPSGQLHLGHARVYYIGDSLARYFKLRDFEVIYPIGFDSFGLPAENAAFVHGKSPRVWTETNIALMKDQLNSLCINFDWDRQICTHKPQYYKWTQQIFISMFLKGLVVKAESEINWDPIDKTVLANEQVDNEGRSWRSGAVVEKKMLAQWSFKITSYAEELQENLSNLQWIDKVKSMQAGWIGFKRGHLIQMQVVKVNQQFAQTSLSSTELQELRKDNLKVFVDNLAHLQEEFYIRYNKQESKTSHKQIQDEQVIVADLLHPITKKKVPVVVGQEQNGIKFELVLSSSNNLKKEKGLSKDVLKQVKSQSVSVMRIKDWSISRQRYWGTPIPIIYCSNCGIVPVPSQELPVKLPEWKGEGNPLLSQQFKSCKCPQCHGDAQRETETMDTFVDSSWYFLRFLDPQNNIQLCSSQKIDFWMPVDIYIGGIEHAIMHLLYARFFTRVLSDLKVCSIKQPFKQLVVQGLVKGKAIRHKTTGKYLKPTQILHYPPNEIEETYEKMSKSKFNGLNPQHLVNKFGPDALRIALFFASPPEHDIDFHEDLLAAAQRFLKKVEELFKTTSVIENKGMKLASEASVLKARIEEFSSTHHGSSLKIKRILLKLQVSLQKKHMHVCIANVMELFNEIKEIIRQDQLNISVAEMLLCYIFAPVLSIFAPKTIQNIFHIDQCDLALLQWPSSQYFIQFSQYFVMKGNKLVNKGVIELKEGPMAESLIRNQLGLAEDALVKINKKSIVIIIK